MDLLMFIIMFIVWSIVNVRMENNRIRNLRRKAKRIQRQNMPNISVSNTFNNNIRKNSYSNYNLGYRYHM